MVLEGPAAPEWCIRMNKDEDGSLELCSHARIYTWEDQETKLVLCPAGFKASTV